MGDLNYPVKAITAQIPEQKTFESKPFPLVLSPDTNSKDANAPEVCSWAKENQSTLKQQLLDHGAILFRNFKISSPEDFDSFVKSFDLAPFPYIGGAAPRRVITGNVFTANESPPSEPIPFHHEMAQVPDFPKVLFFYCNIPPTEGGQTPIAHSNMVYQRMQDRAPDLVRRLEDEGVRYIRTLPDEDDPNSPIGRSWKSTYLTQEKSEAEARAKEQGTTIEWLPNGCLKTTTKVLPAIRIDERTGKKTWFNSVIAAYLGWQDSRNDRKTAVSFANGEFMQETEMETLRATLDESAVDFPWQKGDVLMVDNRQALHARRTFTPPRQILACLCKDS